MAASEKPEKTAYVYMVRCAGGQLYTGWTNDPEARLKAHQSGKGAKYTRTHTALDLGRHRIALPAGDSILQGRENCDKIIRYRGVQLPFGLRLPVTLVTETVAGRAVYDGERPEDEARAEGQKQLEAQLAQTIGDDGRVLKADVSARRQGAYLMVTLRAECEEQIGVDAPLTITSDTGR